MIPHADLQRTTNTYVISISNYLRLWLFSFKLLEEIFSSKFQNSCQLLFVEWIWAARTNEKENGFWAVKSALLQHKTIPKFFLIKARSKFSTQHYKKLFYSSLSCSRTESHCKGDNLYLLGGNWESLRSLPNCSCSTTTTRFPQTRMISGRQTGGETSNTLKLVFYFWSSLSYVSKLMVA